MSVTLSKIESNAKELLLEQIEAEDLTKSEAQDRIREVADSCVPVYYHEVLEVASSSVFIALEMPEIWPAFGETTPMNLMISNIYEHICESLHVVLDEFTFFLNE